MDVLASLCTDCQFLAKCWINIGPTRMSLSTTRLDLYFVFIFVSAENAGSHKYVVANGNKMFTALLDNSGYSVDTLSQKLTN